MKAVFAATETLASGPNDLILSLATERLTKPTKAHTTACQLFQIWPELSLDEEEQELQGEVVRYNESCKG
jgi:hypothetical protein